MVREKKVFENYKKTLMAGFYMFIILSIMERLGKPTYGYEIAKLVESLSDGKFRLPVGTMYPILKKLQSKKLVRSFWAESKEGPPRKYYELTDEGRVFLSELKEFWSSLKDFVEELI